MYDYDHDWAGLAWDGDDDDDGTDMMHLAWHGGRFSFSSIYASHTSLPFPCRTGHDSAFGLLLNHVESQDYSKCLT